MSHGLRIRNATAGQARLGQSLNFMKIEPVVSFSSITFIQESDQPLELVGDPQLYDFEPGLDKIDIVCRRRRLSPADPGRARRSRRKISGLEEVAAIKDISWIRNQAGNTLRFLAIFLVGGAKGNVRRGSKGLVDILGKDAVHPGPDEILVVGFYVIIM